MNAAALASRGGVHRPSDAEGSEDFALARYLDDEVASPQTPDLTVSKRDLPDPVGVGGR